MSPPLVPASPHVKEGDRVGVPWLYTRLRALRALPGWLGDALPRTAEHRLFGSMAALPNMSLADPNYVGHLPDNVDFLDIAPI